MPMKLNYITLVSVLWAGVIVAMLTTDPAAAHKRVKGVRQQGEIRVNKCQSRMAPPCVTAQAGATRHDPAPEDEDGGRAPRSRGRPLVRRARHARRAAARTV